jgi:hypothetical protein
MNIFMVSVLDVCTLHIAILRKLRPTSEKPVTALWSSLKYRVIKNSLCATDDYNTESYKLFLPHFLAQTDWLAADRQGQGGH